MVSSRLLSLVRHRYQPREKQATSFNSTKTAGAQLSTGCLASLGNPVLSGRFSKKNLLDQQSMVSAEGAEKKGVVQVFEFRCVH